MVVGWVGSGIRMASVGKGTSGGLLGIVGMGGWLGLAGVCGRVAMVVAKKLGRGSSASMAGVEGRTDDDAKGVEARPKLVS